MLTISRLAVLASGLMLMYGNAMAQNNPPAAPAPAAAASSSGAPAGVDNKTYEIGPQDVLRILVYEKPELSQTVAVQPDGMISLPLIDDYIKAAGLTPDKLKTALTEAWKKTINSPEVTVQVMEVRSKTFRIMGPGIANPRTFAITQPIKIVDAIADAGGFREYAKEKDILIYRNGKTLHFNMKDWRKGKDQDKNIVLENGDIIEVRN